MGENDTAGLDPIFYFHHCNVDRMFWVWQKKHGYTDQLDIIPEYPGTNTVDSQGPTPGMAPNSWLTLESPLNPFKKEDGESFSSLDCINIEKQLGFTYSIGSLDSVEVEKLRTLKAVDNSKLIKVSNINRAPIRGSFLISAFAVVDGEKKHIGTEAVLNRWDTKYCANCQTHLEVKAFFKLPVSVENTLKSLKNTSEQIHVEIKGRDGLLSGNENNKLLKSDGKPAINLKVEVI
jgi:tyrosinase